MIAVGQIWGWSGVVMVDARHNGRSWTGVPGELAGYFWYSTLIWDGIFRCVGRVNANSVCCLLSVRSGVGQRQAAAVKNRVLDV